MIDATSDKATTTIDIGGEAGNTHYDAGSGCVLVAVQSRDQLVAIDPASNRLVGRYDLDASCQGPHGFLVDAPRRLAFVSCEENAALLVVDLRSMTVTATYPVGDQPDVLVDAHRAHLGGGRPAHRGQRRPHLRLHGLTVGHAAQVELDARAILAAAVIPEVTAGAQHSYHLFVIELERRQQVISRLRDSGIESGIHYATPVHLMPAYRFLGCSAGALPLTERIAGRVLSLPCYPELSMEDVERVCSVVNDALAE